eukprot:scaffold109035_cov32-Tisochrysis_lutea.AAC.1
MITSTNPTLAPLVRPQALWTGATISDPHEVFEPPDYASTPQLARAMLSLGWATTYESAIGAVRRRCRIVGALVGYASARLIFVEILACVDVGATTPSSSEIYHTLSAGSSDRACKCPERVQLALA